MGKINDTSYDETAFDQMTGLPTREILEEHFQYLLNEEIAGKAGLLPVLVLKLGYYKDSVPNLNFLEREKLLRALIRRLNIPGVSTITSLDAGHYALVLVGPEQGDIPGFISAQVSRVLKTITPPVRLTKSRQVKIAVNIGVACYPCDGETVETLLENALTAANAAQSDGENCYRFYTKY